MSDVSERIRSHRKKRGWTQLQLAQQAGVSRETVTRVENGRTPDYETLDKVAAAFGVTRHVLLPSGIADSPDEVAALVQAEGFTSLNVISKLRHLASVTPHDDVRSEARIGLFVGALAMGDCQQLCSIITENQRHSYDFGPNASGILKTQRQILHFLRGTQDFSSVARHLRDAADHWIPTMHPMTHDLGVLGAGFLTWVETLRDNSYGAEQALQVLEASARSDLDTAHFAEIYISCLTERERWSEAECVARYALRNASGPMYTETLRASLGDARAHLGIMEQNFDKVRGGIKLRVECLESLVAQQVGISLPQVLIDLANVACLVAVRFDKPDVPELQAVIPILARAGVVTATLNEQRPPGLLDIIRYLLQGAERLIASNGQTVYLPELYRVEGQRLLLTGQKQEAMKWLLKALKRAQKTGNKLLESRARRSLAEITRLPRTFTFPSCTWHTPPLP